MHKTSKTRRIRFDDTAKRMRSAQLEVKFADELQTEQPIQILREGNFNHPFFGPFDITKKVLDSMVSNFDDHVLKKDIALDFSHNSHAEAAAWFKGLFVDKDIKGRHRLMATVDFTKLGREKIEDKQFRYVSADFAEAYKDNETGEMFGPTLFGAGLTNIPFVKEMTPVIQLSELPTGPQVIENKPKQVKLQQGVNGMNLEQALAAIAELKIQLAGQTAGIKLLSDRGMTLDQTVIKLDDLKGQVKTLSEKNVSLEADIAKGEKKTAFVKLLSEGKVCPAQEEAYMADDMVKFAELASEKKIKLDEQGKEVVPAEEVTDENMTSEDAIEKLNELTETKLSEGKYDSTVERHAAFMDTYKKIRLANPKLAAAANKTNY